LTQNDSNTNEWIFKKVTNEKLISFKNFCFGINFFHFCRILNLKGLFSKLKQLVKQVHIAVQKNPKAHSINVQFTLNCSSHQNDCKYINCAQVEKICEDSVGIKIKRFKCEKIFSLNRPYLDPK